MQHVQPVLSWTLRDFVCSRCCCSNSFFEASNKKKKRMQHWQKALDLQLCKITPFLSPSLCPHTQLPAVPRLPDWARYPEFSPTLALRREGQTKNKRTNLMCQYCRFPSSQSDIPLGKNAERKGQKEHKSSWWSFWRCWQIALMKAREIITHELCQHA